MILRLASFFILTALMTASIDAAEAQNRVRRNVEIEWESIEGASGYEIQVTRKDESSKKPLVFKTNEAKWIATIKPGAYIMQLRAFDDRGVPGSWSPGSELLVKLPSIYPLQPESNKILQSKDPITHSVPFSWEKVPGAAKYKLTASSEDNSWTYEKELEDTSVTVDVPVANGYRWEVVAFDPKGEEGDRWKISEQFEVHGPALKKPTIEKPMSQYIREIRWSEPEYAKNYRYDLNFYNKKKKKWEVVESRAGLKEAVLPVDSSRPTGTYRLVVTAQSERREDSAYSKIDFKMKGGFRTPASLNTAILRDSITKPTNFYFIASYFATQAQYEFTNHDDLANVSFDAMGGVGRLGLGYQGQNSKWGAFGIADMSTFIIGGQNFNFTSIELHATRSLRAGRAGQFLLGAGVYSREIPVVEGTPAAGFSGAGKVSTMGPHIGFTYWVPMSDRYGLQVNGRAYYSLMGSAPNGDVEATVSYQMGVLGSYRMSSSWMAYMGYAYRADNVSYNTRAGDALSFAQPGQMNEVRFQGHFINMMFEFSF